MLRYVDDLFSAVSWQLGSLARSIIENVIKELGFTLAQEKTEGPVTEQVVLGVQVRVTGAQLFLQPEPAKAARWCHDIRTALDRDTMGATEASKRQGG